MKYYIDDKLVRTSDRTYTHAVMYGDKVVSCSGNYELAMKELNRRISGQDGNIADCKLAIKAIDAGKTYYMTKCCRKSYKAKVNGTREEYLAYIADYENRKALYHIRELEAR